MQIENVDDLEARAKAAAAEIESAMDRYDAAETRDERLAALAAATPKVDELRAIQREIERLLDAEAA